MPSVSRTLGFTAWDSELGKQPENSPAHSFPPHFFLNLHGISHVCTQVFSIDQSLKGTSLWVLGTSFLHGFLWNSALQFSAALAFLKSIL